MQVQTDLKEIKERLLEEQTVLHKRVDVEREKAKPSSMSNPDRADLALDYGYRDRRLSLLKQLEEQLADINQALARIEEGTYGTCTECGNAIAPERLEAIPYAALCIDCQRKA